MIHFNYQLCSVAGCTQESKDVVSMVTPAFVTEFNSESDPLYTARVWLDELYIIVPQKKIRTETSPEVLR